MISVEVQDKLGPTLSRLASEMDGPDRVRVSRSMGGAVRSLIVRHLQELGNSRHRTADRLGGKPTGYISELADKFDDSSTVNVDQDGVSILMRHPILTRAVRDVTIVPKNGQFLTIPMNAIAYGHRVGEFEKFVLLRKGEGAKTDDGEKKKEREPIRQDIAVFLLVRSVTQKRDPSLLPTFDKITTAAAKGAGSEIKEILVEAKRL